MTFTDTELDALHFALLDRLEHIREVVRESNGSLEAGTYTGDQYQIANDLAKRIRRERTERLLLN